MPGRAESLSGKAVTGGGGGSRQKGACRGPAGESNAVTQTGWRTARGAQQLHTGVDRPEKSWHLRVLTAGDIASLPPVRAGGGTLGESGNGAEITRVKLWLLGYMAGGHGKAKPEPRIKGQGPSVADRSGAAFTLSLGLLKPFLAQTELAVEPGPA